MGPERARSLWRLLEAVHAIVYFAPEPRDAMKAAGLKGFWMGYFAGRAAPLGAVPAEVVLALFYNFAPRMVRRSIPDAWGFATPDRVLEARYTGAGAALRRILGERTADPGVAEAAALARRAAEAADPAGRPLFAANLALPWPAEPHLQLWHAATLLREHRGDGHVASLVAAGLDGCEAHVTFAAASGIPADTFLPNRGWTEEEWAAAGARLRGRGLLDEAGALTSPGRELRDAVEDGTDRLALPPYVALGEEAAVRLADSAREVARAVVAAGDIPFPNPIGLPRTPELVG